MNSDKILAFRIPSEVNAGITAAAERKFTARTAYLRQVIVEAVTRDLGLAKVDMKAGAK